VVVAFSLLEILRPDDLIADVSLRPSAEAAQRSPKQLAKGHLVTYQNAVVGLSLRSVFAVEEHVVSDVVREERAPLLDCKGQLFRIGQSTSLQLHDMLRIETPPPKRFSK
jgi:hypothetical protein